MAMKFFRINKHTNKNIFKISCDVNIVYLPNLYEKLKNSNCQILLSTQYIVKITYKIIEVQFECEILQIS